MRYQNKGRPTLILMPSPMVTQADLGEVEFLRGERRRIDRQLAAIAEALFSRLGKGAKVEAGPLNAEIEERRCCGKAERVLLVNGRTI